MKKILLLFLMFFILSAVAFAQPETEAAPPMILVSKAVVEPAGFIADIPACPQVVIISDNAIILDKTGEESLVNESLQVRRDYTLHNPQRQIESITIFGFA